MSVLKTSSRWPLYLAIAGMVIVGASVWYTQRLANKIAYTENELVELYQKSIERINTFDESIGEKEDYSTEFEVAEIVEYLPRILVNDVTGEFNGALGFGSRDDDTTYVMAQLEQWIEEGVTPIRQPNQLQYIGESRLIRQIRYFPIFQFFLIGTFIFLGYLGINQARKAEQNRVWVGMAKETAHQLGTPISAIMGWVDYLKTMYPNNEDIGQVSDELGRDVDRLSMVANRFSKIGAAPELEPVNLFAELDRCQAYMRKRAPRKVNFDFPAADAGEIRAAINPLLFDWVVENLLRNALDAMDGKGQISGRVRELEDKVYIDITDTGKGIAAKNIRKVFNPGFTTKKRGWGLGLSLVKRIVEEYHRGKIAVSHSEPGVGTTFTITLPRV